MNFEIIEENSKDNNIISPCQTLHLKIASDHNTYFQTYIKEKENNVFVDLLKQYTNMQYDGISCEFTLKNDSITLIHYNIPIIFQSDSLKINNEYKSFAKTSIHNKHLDKFIMHKIYIGKLKKIKSNIQIYHMLKNFYYIYINTEAIQQLNDYISLLYNHEIIKETFYNPGCICIFFNKDNLKTNENIVLTNIINFITLIINEKFLYYQKSATNIKLIIEHHIKNHIYEHIKQNYKEIFNIYQIIQEIINIQEQYLYQECKCYDLNFSLLEHLLITINSYQIIPQKNNHTAIICMIFLTSFINSNDFIKLHPYYQQAIKYIISKSNIGEFIANLTINTETFEIFEKQICSNNNIQTKAEIFIYITNGQIIDPNILHYKIFDIFQFLRQSNNMNIFN